jgi:hypothetical protein
VPAVAALPCAALALLVSRPPVNVARMVEEAPGGVRLAAGAQRSLASPPLALPTRCGRPVVS